MEFWGVEVKPGSPCKIEAEGGYIIHISQAALGESKKGENEPVSLYVKVDGKALVMGTLVSEKHPQVSLDLFVEQDFELYHNCKSSSVYFLGYKAPDVEEIDEDEDIPMDLAMFGKPNTNELKGKKDDESDSEDDDEDEYDESDSEDANEMGLDSDDEDDDDEDEDEETPKKVEPPSKKRPNGSAVTTPASKKAKTATPQKTDGKKGSNTATPNPAKSGNKGAQSPKSGAQNSCGPCKKSFNSEVGLQSHNKAKHGAK